MKKNSKFRIAAISATTLWLTLFAVVPFLLIFAVSFMREDHSQFFNLSFSLAGYSNIFSPVFAKVLWRSVYLSGITTLLCLLIGYPFAYILGRMESEARQKLLLLLVIIPFWTNSLIRTYALVFLMKTKGLINGILLSLGLISSPFKIYYTETAVFIGLVYVLLPFMILPLFSAIEKLDGSLLEAAQDLGAGPIRTFMKVTLPLTVPGIAAGCMLVFLPALGMFYVPDLLGGARSMLLGNYIKNQFLTSQNWPAGSAASVVLTLMMVGLLLLYSRSGGKVDEGGHAG
jgi:spermidine/putrescine transport system permease protein